MVMATEISTAPMRKFLNDPADVVKESLAGLGAAHPELVQYDADAQILIRVDAPIQGKVALISGGGSGHEPLHGGFVGRGCSTPLVRVRCSPRRSRSRCSRRRRPSTAVPASFTSSRTTRAT
jgi:hypothetical protein